MKKFKFNIPYISQSEFFNIKKIFKSDNFINLGFFYKKCVSLIKNKIKAKHIFLTNSCTSAIEAALLSLKLDRDDEVIIQSYTFVSIVDILFKLGIKFKFCDVDKFFTIDLNDLKKKINKNTRVIILTHYNGNSINFRTLKNIIKKKNIIIIEDAAQVYGAKYKNYFLGSIGDFGAFSFHQTKNIHSGSGGALILNNQKYYRNLRDVLDRGTNKTDFINNKANKYSWVSRGVSSSITEMQSVFLLSQLKDEKKVLNKREELFKLYKKEIRSNDKFFEICNFNKFNKSNYHMFYILLKSNNLRPKFIKFMAENKIEVTSHYEPLHLSTVIQKTKAVKEKLPNTEKYAKRIVRLPFYFELKKKDIEYICNKINIFFK